MAKLNARQAAFVREYLIDLNATQAAKRAGYKGNDKVLATIGWQNLRKVEIRDEVTRLLNERALSREEVVHRIGEQARGNMSDFLHIAPRVRPRWAVKKDADGNAEWIEEEEHYTVIELDLEAAKAAGKLGLIKKFREGKDGVSFELYSAQEALNMLAKAHGIYGDAGVGNDGDFDEWLESLPAERDEL